MITTHVEAVSATLKSFGYQFDIVGSSDFRFQVCTTPGRFWRSQLLVSGDIAQLTTFLTDELYLPSQRAFVLETACRLNEAAGVLGSWIFDWDTGSCRYYAGVDLRGQMDISEALRRCLNSLSFPIKLWARCFERRAGGTQCAPLSTQRL
jgi:hypothetical protein